MPIVNGWNVGEQDFGRTSGSDGAQAITSQVGRDGISSDLMAYLGLTPAKLQQIEQDYRWSHDPQEGYDPSSAIQEAVQSAMAAKGLHLGQKSSGNNQGEQQLFDANNQPVGPQYHVDLEQDPGGVFAAGIMGAASLATAGAAGAFSGSGAFGLGGAADGAGGIALQEGGLPASLGGAGAGAGGTAASTSGMFQQLAQKYGTQVASTLMKQYAGGGADSASGSGTGGSMNPDGSLNWGQIIGAAGSLYSAAQADKIGGAITDAGTAALQRQTANATSAAAMAQQAWEQQRDTWNPAQLEAAKANATISADTAAKQGANADYYSGLTKDFIDQGKKSWKYQDMAMQTADDYASGKMANTMADEANADVNQKYADADASMQRNAARYGINPGSGAFTGAMADMYNQKALAGAGAQTAARRAARDKAEQMVATAAGAGQASFGNGLQAGSLATGAANSAVAAGAQGVNGWSTANNSVANGNNSANYGVATTTAANNSIGTIGRDLNSSNSGSRVGNLVGGTGSGWAKMGTGISTAIGGALGGDGVTAAPSYAAGGGDGGFGGSFDAWNSGVIPD